MAYPPSDLPATPIGRRRVIQGLLGFSILSTAAGILTPILAYLWPRDVAQSSGGPIEVGKVEDFPPGSGQVVSVNDKPVIVVNTKSGGIKAFSAICTHLGCIAAWDSKRGIIHCPCHDGFFNPVTGVVVSGPPPRPLPGYELAVKDGKVLVGKPLGQLFGS